MKSIYLITTELVPLRWYRYSTFKVPLIWLSEYFFAQKTTWFPQGKSRSLSLFSCRKTNSNIVIDVQLYIEITSFKVNFAILQQIFTRINKKI